ncbi:hypothetical protein VULLAG_LOCUS12432 [Vulpes lagopus]
MSAYAPCAYVCVQTPCMPGGQVHARAVLYGPFSQRGLYPLLETGVHEKNAPSPDWPGYSVKKGCWIRGVRGRGPARHPRPESGVSDLALRCPLLLDLVQSRDINILAPS